MFHTEDVVGNINFPQLNNENKRRYHQWIGRIDVSRYIIQYASGIRGTHVLMYLERQQQ